MRSVIHRVIQFLNFAVLLWPVLLGQTPATLPEVLGKTQLFGSTSWRWIALLLLLPTAVGLAWLICAVFFRAVSVVVRRTPWTLDDDILAMVIGPLRLLLTVWVFHSGMLAAELPFLARQSIGVLELMLAVIAV